MNIKVSNAKPVLATLLAVGVLFVSLRLFGAIAWQWIWVLSPLWISVVAMLIPVVFVIILMAICWVCDGLDSTVSVTRS